jgi:hypothetical protein
MSIMSATRIEYLESLAKEYAVPVGEVKLLAEIFGEEQDRTGLVEVLQNNSTMKAVLNDYAEEEDDLDLMSTDLEDAFDEDEYEEDYEERSDCDEDFD